MTKNFDKMLKVCLEQTQTPAAGAEMLKALADLIATNKPEVTKDLGELLKKHQPAQTQPKPPQTPQPPKPGTPSNQQQNQQIKPGTTPNQQQPNNNAANKPA